MFNNSVLASRLTAEIERKGLTKKDFGLAIGASDVMVSYWCNGKRTPLLHQIVDMAEYFGVTVDFLVGLSDHPERAPSLADDLGLSDLAISNMRAIASDTDRRSLLNKLLEYSGLSSVLGNISLAHKLRGEMSGNIKSVKLPAAILSEVSKHGYVVLSNRESADYIEDKALSQLRTAFDRRV